MATLYVAEFERPRNQWVTIANAPPIAEQTIAIGGSSTQATNAFNAKTAMIRVETDSICSIAIGANPTATTTNMRMNAGDCEYFSVMPNHKIAVISNT
jgi:hypothetical protein